jgi:NAD(P)-dependent dehydrogenase (short-subunit alcohol dehydrogenase family)
MVLIGLVFGRLGFEDEADCAAAKAGIVALTKALGRELGPLGIAVNAIAPSVIDTQRLTERARIAGVSAAEFRARQAARVPLGRIATPAEIAATVAFLTDERMPALVGQILHADGGTNRTRA